MKSLKILAIVLVFAVMARGAELDLTKFKYQARVNIAPGRRMYCRLVLTPQVYDKALEDLADIRLANAAGEQIPYVLAEPADVTRTVKYEPTIINRSTGEENQAMLTLDFGQQLVKDSIEVVTGGDNFRRPVKVEGSNDNVNFFTLVKEAFVFAIGDKYKSRFSKVDLPANDYRYLRISVQPMTSQGRSPVIEQVNAFKTEKILAERVPVELILLKQTEDANTNSSIYVFDTGFKNLSVTELELNVAEDSFYRYVTLEGRDQETKTVKICGEDNRERFEDVEESWKHITRGTIYRYSTEEGESRKNVVLHIPSGSRFYRYLKVSIMNYDDKPVTISRVRAELLPAQLIFETGENGELMLFFGSESAKGPRYDIKNRLKDPLKVEARTACLGEISDNPLFGKLEPKLIPWTERHKVLLLSVMVIIVLVLGTFILKSLKSIQNQQPPD
jgi:hypothetical protein